MEIVWRCDDVIHENFLMGIQWWDNKNQLYYDELHLKQSMELRYASFGNATRANGTKHASSRRSVDGPI